VKNGSDAAHQRFFDFPEMRQFYCPQPASSLIISKAKKILSLGAAIFQWSHLWLKSSKRPLLAEEISLHKKYLSAII